MAWDLGPGARILYLTAQLASLSGSFVDRVGAHRYQIDMDKKPRFFLYDRKEVAVLIVLAIMVAVFAFTYGIHMGKSVGPKGTVAAQHGHEATAVNTLADQVPNRQELTEQGVHAGAVAEEALSQSLREEVGRSGIRLDTPRQVDLPSTTRTEKTQNESSHDPSSENLLKQKAPSGQYTLQVGSHPSFEEAQAQFARLKEAELRPFVREAELEGKGKWYRVYVGGFASRELAEKAGVNYRESGKIDSFVLANNTFSGAQARGKSH